MGRWALTRPPHSETPARDALNVQKKHTRLAYPRASSSLQQAPNTPLRRRALPAPPSGGARTGREHAPSRRSRSRLSVASARALLATARGAQPERARGRAHRSKKEAASASASNRSGRRELTSSAAALIRSLFLYFGVSEKKLYLEKNIFFLKWRWPRVSGRFSLHQDGLCRFRRGHQWWLDCQSSPDIFEARSRALHVADSPSRAAGRLGLGLGGQSAVNCEHRVLSAKPAASRR